jgi:polar amino acid transport system substrate-binding protein
MTRAWLARIFVALAGFPAFSQGMSAQEIVVPYERNYPPFSVTTAEGDHDGFNIAVARALADAAGLDVRFEAVGFFEISDGDWPPEWGFTVASISYLEARAALYTYLDRYLFDEVVLVARDPADGGPLPPVAGSRIGVCRTCAYRTFLEGNFEAASDGEPAGPPFDNIVIDDSFSNETAMIEALSLSAAAPFDFVVVSRFFAELLFMRSGYPIRIAGEPLYFDPLWVVVSNDRSDLHEPLRAALAQLREDGALAELSVRYLGADFTRLP